LGLYQRACFGTRPSSILSTCSSQSCLYLLILSLTENTPNSFLISTFLQRISYYSYYLNYVFITFIFKYVKCITLYFKSDT
jgi:hypothetical protein